MSGFLVGNVVQ